jgi:nucleoid-associated protein YgaU
MAATGYGPAPATGTPLSGASATGALHTNPASEAAATPAEPDAGWPAGTGQGEHRTGSWIVRPGDNLWTISEAALAAAWKRPPTVSEVGAYWWQVVQLNRPRLPRPSDPDLLFPGDEVRLPAPPSGPPPS